MSVPPVNYSVPPPQLNMPPPRLPRMVSAAIPPSPPPSYNHPPPPLPPAPSVNYSVSIPMLNMPPPTLISYPPPIDVHIPPFPPPTAPANYRLKKTSTPMVAKDSELNTVNKEKSSSSSRLSYDKDKHISKASLGYKNHAKSDSDRSKDFNKCDSPKTTGFDKSASKNVYNTEKLHHQHSLTKSSVPSSRTSYSPRRDRERTYATDKNYDCEKRYSGERQVRHEKECSPSTSHLSYRSESLSRSSHRDRDRERYDKERYEYERERYEYERKRYEYEHRHSSSHRSSSTYRSHSSHSQSYDSHTEKRHHRSAERRSCYSPGTEAYRRSHTQDHSPRSISHKAMTDREKILVEYSKNYCRTPEDYIEKMQRWTEKEKLDGETPKVWYRNSPAELYYKTIEGGDRVEQTSKLEKLCNVFYKNLIERGTKARPEIDELPPLKAPKAKMCKHRLDEKSSSSSSSSEGDEDLDKDGLQGYTDRIMLELQRKQSHPKRLHPEMWYNNTGEMNSGPLCRCSAKARRQGMRHGIYAGEETFPKCIPTQNNLDKLYHYHITVSPPTNFLIKAPTMIHHDEHEFLFAGFSMFSHYKLAKLPNCKVIRFNIEYTILYIEEAAPKNFTIQELDLFENYLFTELLELIDLDLGKATESSCSQFHFMPRFVRSLPEGGCEVLSMCEVLRYLVEESGLLIPPDMLEIFHNMDNYSWQKFVDRIKGMIVTYPGKKPCSVRVDQLDRSPPVNVKDGKSSRDRKSFYPEIVHFGMRPPLLSYAGNPEYQKAWRYYVKYRHLIANMAKPSYNERQKLAAKEAKLQEMRTQTKMKRDVTVVISSEGFHTTGLMCDVVQHAMLIPVLVRHLRFHKSLNSLEAKIGYVFKQRALLQTALTHPSYRENFGTNPDHARNSLTNCGIRQPQYGDRRIHYTRKKGIVTLINIMSRPGKSNETESEIKHYERLEFLGDAVVEFLSSIHLFRMFPGLAEGGLATYRASVVQNQHLAQLAKNIGLEQYMLYAHGSDLCQDVVMRHAMANCFEALMGALFLDAGLEVADRVFALSLWHAEPQLLEVWMKERPHPLQEQEPLGDRQYIKDFEFLKKLTKFEESIGVTFKHIRLLARAFTDRSVGFTHLTLGSNQRLEFLGDTVLQLVVSDKLYRHFPEHHEGHLSLLRSSLVNNRTQSLVCDDLDMSTYAIYNNPKAKPTTKKHKADLLEAFLGALYIDKGLEFCQAFCNACLFPRLQEFIINQDWNDPKSKLQQCCLTLRSMEGGEPDIPLYKVIECLGPTNTRVYTVGVYFRGTRLAAARGHSIQEAEMNAAEQALSCAHELFPQLDHQKRIIAKNLRKKKNRHPGEAHDIPPHLARAASLKRKSLEEKVPKAYRLDKKTDSSDESSAPAASESEDEAQSLDESKSEGDSGLDSDTESVSQNKLGDVKVSSLVSDMEKIKEDFIRRNEYEKLKEKCRKSDSDDD